MLLLLLPPGASTDGPTLVAATNLLLLSVLPSLLPLLLLLLLLLLVAVLLLPGESPDSSCRMNTGNLLGWYNSGWLGCTSRQHTHNTTNIAQVVLQPVQCNTARYSTYA
jgi:hypothetical protein